MNVSFHKDISCSSFNVGMLTYYRYIESLKNQLLKSKIQIYVDQ